MGMRVVVDSSTDAQGSAGTERGLEAATQDYSASGSADFADADRDLEAAAQETKFRLLNALRRHLGLQELDASSSAVVNLSGEDDGDNAVEGYWGASDEWLAAKLLHVRPDGLLAIEWAEDGSLSHLP